MKLNILHLVMEYPNNQNLFKIKVKKSNLCEICEDEGLSAIDSTEHNLFDCVCLSRGESAAVMREKIWRLLSKINDLNVNIVRTISDSDPTQAANVILNCTSSGIDEKLRIHFKNPYVSVFVRLCQQYLLLAHNLRQKHVKLMQHL